MAQDAAASSDATPRSPLPGERTVSRYVSLAEARPIECNGCGDCCDSRRTGGYWTWGDLPADQYAAMYGGPPLIIPIEPIEGGEWRDRARTELDGATLSGTRFRCAAFDSALDDASGSCRLHDGERLARCGEFPVWGDAIERELRDHSKVPLQIGAFPRCSLHDIIVVRDDDLRRM